MTHIFLRGVAIICGLVLASGIAAHRGYGQTYGIDFRNTLMPASGGMAGTSVAAPQDFISAINANPAALTQYRGTNFTLGGAFAEATVNLTQSAPAPALGVAPFSAKSSTPGAIVPATSTWAYCSSWAWGSPTNCSPTAGYFSPPTPSTSTGGARRSSRTSTGASG